MQKTTRIKLFLYALSLFFISNFSQANNSQNTINDNPLLLTGYVKAKDNQAFYAPKTDSWQVQIKWMLEEGETAKEGELVVVFDSGSIESQIEQEEISLLAAKEELHRLTKSGEQSTLEAKYALSRAELLLKRAKIDANIPKKNLSDYDYQKYNVAFEKALVARIKAKDKFTQANISQQVSINKQNLKISEYQDSLEYNRYKLSKMTLYAKRTGPILYADHPWNGEKIFVGMTVRASWKVAEISTLSELYIETWVHEVDYNKIQQNQTALLSFDAFPQYKTVANLTQLYTQPEKRKTWGNDVYFKAMFKFNTNQSIKLLPGMSALLDLNKNITTAMTGDKK